MSVADWIVHRRPDGEIVGYVEDAADGFIARDLLGRPLAGPGDWLAAEAVLDTQTLSAFDGVWCYTDADGQPFRTRIAELSPTAAVVVEDRFGAIDGPSPRRFEIALPVPDHVLVPAPPVDEWPAN